MTAPALILLATGSTDPQVIETIHSLRHGFQAQRQGLSIHLAFTDDCPPTGPQVVNTLVARGVTEMVFVPISLMRAIESPHEVTSMLERVHLLHPEIRYALARPLGPDTRLLNILDDRLRDSLSLANVTELDALVLSVPSDADTRGQALTSRRSRQWSGHHRLPCVVAAGDGGLSVASAISQLRSQGRRHIAVGSLFLAADDEYQAQASQAANLGAVVSDPIGVDDRLFDMIMARYCSAAMSLVEVAGEYDFVADEVTQHA